MAKAPTLNLTPELPEVRSEDFNLFYRPEAEPLPQGLKDFANSLDSSKEKINKYIKKSINFEKKLVKNELEIINILLN